MTALYTDRFSVAPGESFAIHASSAAGLCQIEIARVGAAREVVLRQPVTVGDHLTPPDADAKGCGWPIAATITAGGDWRSGYYDIALTDAKGETAHHFVCLRAGAAKARMVLVLATNTLHAYNYWGGASAYCHVESLMRREKPLAEAMAAAIGVLSTMRPFPPLLLNPPPDMPRLVTLRPRDFGERTWGGADPQWSRAHGQSPYDGSAGYLHKWEHAFVRWAEGEEGLTFDYLTDFDLDRDPQALGGYDVVLLVGHSEYWSGPERDVLDAFVDRGGRLAIFSGNTGFWKVRWENGGRTLICRKWKGEDEAVPDADKTHLWSHPMFARPEAAITGLSFLYGGYHRLGLCAARGQGGYTIYRDKHWALAGCDLYYGDVIGGSVPLVGYENDGCPIRFGADGLPAPDGGTGVPDNLEIIAFVPAVFAEDPDSPYRPLIPPEQMETVARIAYGDASPATQARVSRGHAVVQARQGRGVQRRHHRMGAWPRGRRSVRHAHHAQCAEPLSGRTRMTDTIEGGCRCGAVRYRVDLDKLPNAYACHCLDCQTWSGSAFSTQFLVPEDALHITGEPHLYERPSEDGTRISRQRGCAKCLTRVYNTNTRRPGLAGVRAGTLDRSDELAIVAHIWTKRKMGGIEIPDGIPQWEEGAPPADFAAALLR